MFQPASTFANLFQPGQKSVLDLFQTMPTQIFLTTQHSYWKSKVFEVQSKMKNVVGKIDVKDLDGRISTSEKMYSGREIPQLKLGDRVTIVASEKRAFKALHKKENLWREGMLELIGNEGYVFGVTLSCTVVVMLINSGIIYHLHRFALEKSQNTDQTGPCGNSGFQIDDDVIIGVDATILQYLQQSSMRTPPQIASQLNGLIGRVMCFYREEVVVTFDEARYEMFNPASLVPYKEGKKTSKPVDMNRKKKDGTRGWLGGRRSKEIKINTKVRLSPNMYNVMALQRGHGEWHYTLTKFLGQIGTIIFNHPNGDINVRFDALESYQLNQEAVEIIRKQAKKRSKSGEKNDHPFRDDLQFKNGPLFKYGEIVRLNIPSQEMKSYLSISNVPLEFEVIAEDYGMVAGYSNQNAMLVDFEGKLFGVVKTMLVKASAKTAKRILQRKEQNKIIKVGDKVVLCIGPKNFVMKCLENQPNDSEKPPTEEGELMGYDNDGNAVIKYGDGKLISISDEYICLPRDDWKTGQAVTQSLPTNDIGQGPGNVNSLEAFILHSITEVLESVEGKDNIPKWSSTIQKMDRNKMLTISFERDVDDLQTFLDTFVSKLRTNESIIINSKVGNEITFGVEDVLYKMAFETGDGSEDILPVWPSAASDFARSMSLTENIAESLQANNLAPPNSNPAVQRITIPRGVQQVVLQFGDVGQMALPVPNNPAGGAQGPPPTPSQIMNPNQPPQPQIFNIVSNEGNTFNLVEANIRSINPHTENVQVNINEQ